MSYISNKFNSINLSAEYKYDIYGRRIQKNVNGVITNFFWEGDNMSFELNENNQPIRRYIYENGKDDVQGYVEYAEVDDPQYFSFERKGWYSYIKDQVGTITKVYKHQTKQMVDTRTYDVFGNIVNQTGSSSGNLGFQSKYYDQESGLNYYYHRYYYASIGRFVNEDPIGFWGDKNFYRFNLNNPINFIDAFGLRNKIFKRPPIDPCGNPLDPFNNRSSQENALAMISKIPEQIKKDLINRVKMTAEDSKIFIDDLCCILDCAAKRTTFIFVTSVILEVMVHYILTTTEVGIIAEWIIQSSLYSSTYVSIKQMIEIIKDCKLICNE